MVVAGPCFLEKGNLKRSIKLAYINYNPHTQEVETGLVS